MNSDKYIGNFGPRGSDRLEFVPVEERPVEATPARTKWNGASSERREFERVIATIMGAVKEFPDALKRVVEALKREMILCPT